MTNNVILNDTAWSFAEPIPASPEQLVLAVEKYHATINEPFNRGALVAISPFTQIDLAYEYTVQKPTGEWEHIPVVVRVGDGTRPLTYAEILWQFHSKAHQNLHNQDHHYFEGFAPKEHNENSGIPTYEVYLGS